jgi:hypothetical protein
MGGEDQMKRSFDSSQWQLVLLQLKEKTRKQAFLWTLLLLAVLTFFYFPSNNQSYVSFTTVIHSSILDGSYRGIYNSTWMGLLVVLFLHIIFIFAGIYFIRNVIKKDMDSHMDIYIRSTPISIHRYLESKRLSNFLYLCCLAIAVEGMAIVMQYSRGESSQLIVLSYVLPFLILVVPFLYVMASLSVCLDMFKLFRKTFGSILIFMMSIGYLSYLMMGLSGDSINPYFDFTGILFIMKNVLAQFIQQMGLDRWDGGFALFQNIEHYDNTFVMSKVSWDIRFILSRLIVVGTAFAFVHLLGRFRSYDRLFHKETMQLKRLQHTTDKQQELQTLLSIPFRESDIAEHVHPSVTLNHAHFRIHSGSILSKEFIMYWRDLNKSHLLLIPLFIIQLLPQAQQLSGWIFSVASIAPLFLLSNISFQINDLYIRSTLAYKRPYFTVKTLLFVTILILFFSGTFINLLVVQNFSGIVMLVIGLLFSVALAASCSSVSNHLFSFIYMFLWYLGVLQNIAPADLYGIHGDLTISLYYSLIAISMFVFAYRKL